jgi:hypothetical protein
MRSFVKLPGTALLAAAVLFAVVASSSTANAFTFRTVAVPAAAQSGPESVQSVAVNWWQARHARHDVVHTLNQDCRGGDRHSQRRECLREARNTLREMQHEAHDVYTDCRSNGGSRSQCSRAVWQYWVDHANGGSTPTDTGSSDGGNTGGSDGGEVVVTDDLPK